MPRADVETLLAETTWVRRVARGLTRDPHSAAEIEQETWLAAFAHGPIASAPRAWLAEVARNLVRRSARRAARVERREAHAARAEAQPSAAELVERADLARALAGHVLALEEPYRSTLLLRYFEELPPRAIAARERVPVRTIKTRLARGLEHLRARLDASSRGDRQRWLPAVVALAEPLGPLPHAAPAPSSTTDAGLPACTRPTASAPLSRATVASTAPSPVEVLVMKANLKLAAGAALALLALTIAWSTFSQSAQEPAPAAASPEAPRTEPAMSAAAAGDTAPLGSNAGRSALGAVPPMPPPDEAPRLAGRVVDDHRRPVAGARIDLASATFGDYPAGEGPPPPFATAESDADGLFALELAPTRACDVAVSAAGFGTARVARRRGGDWLEIALAREGAVAGRVVERATGAPLTGVRVELRATENAAYNPALAAATTDADGTYRIGGLEARDYWLRASGPRIAPAGFETVAVMPGATTLHDVAATAREEPTFPVEVRGHVVDAADGMPIAGAEVSLGEAEGATDELGRFALVAKAIRADASVRLRIRARGRIEHESQANDGAQVEVALARGAQVRGRVVQADGTPAQGAAITLHSAVKVPRPTAPALVRTAEDGSFALDALRPGTPHVLLARADGLAAAAYDLPALVAGSTFDAGTIELASEAALVGRVVDERGLPWAADIELVGANADRDRYGVATPLEGAIAPRRTRTDAHGRFVVGGLAAGQYELLVRIGGRAQRLQRMIAVGRGALVEVEVQAPRGLALAGRVVDPESAPLAGVFVQAFAQGSTELAGSASTGTDGAFRVEGLELGAHRVRTTLGAVATPAQRERLLANGAHAADAGDEALELVQPLAAEIRGHVLAHDGTPLAGAPVAASAGPGEPVEASTKSGEGGVFRLKVRAGALWRIDVSPPPREGGAAALEPGSRVDVASGATGVEIRLEAR